MKLKGHKQSFRAFLGHNGCSLKKGGALKILLGGLELGLRDLTTLSVGSPCTLNETSEECLRETNANLCAGALAGSVLCRRKTLTLPSSGTTI